MAPPETGLLMRWVNRVQNSFAKFSKRSVPNTETCSAELSDPLVNYYRHRAQTNLPSLYRFALQTRSIDIRNIFAQIASEHQLSLDELVHLLNEFLSEDVTPGIETKITASFDSLVLLTLADLLANTARDDLDTYAAVQIYHFVGRYFGENSLRPENVLQKVEALHELGKYDEAQAVARAHNINEIAPLQSELLRIERLRSEEGALDEWLVELNELYESRQMSRLRLLEDRTLPLLDRLSVDNAVAMDGPKVTVIVPTFSPGGGIRTALRSLLEQTWQNLEIIIVNDASPEEYRDLFSSLEELDPRVRVIHQEKNSGAYVARNVGLRAATGDFVTTHDDDDWSHPDKIAMQIQPLLDDNSLVATTSAHIRTTESLEFKRVNAEARFLQMNYSSLLFRRSLMTDIGEWDSVNRGGDSEFYSRLIEFAGADRVLSLHEQPLSFSRIWDGSLTSGEMYRGFFGYSRLIYRAAFRQWHREVRERGGHLYSSSRELRPYPVPTTFEAGQRNADLGKFDVIYVSDFFRQAKSVNQVLDELATLAALGFRIGFMHLYSPETRSTIDFPQRLFELQMAGKIEQVSHDDVAETELLIVFDASIGMFMDRIDTKVRTHRSIAIEQSAVTLTDVEARIPAFIPRALRNLDACFSTHFKVVGATDKDHSWLKTTTPPGRMGGDDLIWHDHVLEDPGEVMPPSTTPIVGFHSNSNLYRWPNTVDQFRNLYVSDKFSTKFHGPLDKPLARFGQEALQMIELVDETNATELEFLRTIHFWIYWPHSRMSAQIWKPVLSAFRAGKVVILPIQLKPLYGEAAVYAEPRDIERIVSYFSNDSQAYIAQARLGQDFVEQDFTTVHLQNRVVKLLK